MPSYVPPKKNDPNGYVTYVSLRSQADAKVMQANPTLADGDVKIAVDDAAPGNLGTLPVVDADFTKRVKVTLSQAETNGDNLTIIFSDAAGAEWCDLTINIQTSAQTLDTIGTNVVAVEAKTDLIGASVALESAGNLAAVKAKTDLIPADITTQLDTNMPAIKAKTDLLPADTATQLDTNIPAIKAKTDLIPADIATQIDTNIPAILADTGTDGVVIPQAQADKVWATAIRALTDKADFSLSTAGIQAIWDALTSAFTTVGSIGKKLADWVVGTIDTYTGNTKQTGDTFARLGAPTGASVSADVAAVKGDTAAILDDTGTSGVIIPQAQADKAWGTTVRALTDKAGFTISGTKTTLDALNDISTTQVYAEAVAALLAYDPPTRAELTTDKNSIITEVDDLITRVKGLDAIYDSVALRALEATLTAIKGVGWTAESLKAIKDAIDALVTGGATAQEVWEYVTRTLTSENFVV